MKQRESNFELMRIISMLFIVLGHTLSWGGIFNNADHITKMVICVIYCLIVVHVNSFILLSGYFQSKARFKIKKVINLVVLMLSYRVILYFGSLILGLKTYSGIYMTIYNVLPLSNFSYWFLNVYVVLYMLSPFLNKLIKSLNKKSYTILLMIMFFFLSIATRVTLNQFISTSGGYSLIWFIFMYLIGAYLREYKNELYVNIGKKRISFNDNALIFLFIYVFLGLLKCSINYVGYRIDAKSGIMLVLHDNLSYSFKNLIYDDPLIVIQSVAYFIFFSNISVRNRIISKISKCTNEVYLFHMNSNVKPIIYSALGLTLAKYTIEAIPMAFVVAIIIFIMGFIIYYLRTGIIKLISKIKIVGKLSEKYNNKLEKLDKIIQTI